MKTILVPSFLYSASFNTDLKKTFARVRRSQRKEPERIAAAAPAPLNVALIGRKTAVGRG